jgi:5-methylcytosine-specific restriction endonuclease McrA
MSTSLSSKGSSILVSRAVPAALRAEALGHDGFTCHMCGLAPGEIDSATGRRARLHVSYLIDKKLGGKDQLSNLWAACSICIEGSKDIATEKPTSLWLLAQIRRAGQDEQLVVLNWLRKKFKV